jgi:flavodoxin
MAPSLIPINPQPHRANYSDAMKSLIVYYSRSGHTRKIATELAKLFDADIEEITLVSEPGTGLLGYLRAGWSTFTGKDAKLKPARKNPRDYNLVILGTPIWNFALSPPVYAYAKQHARELPKLAFFCTEGGSGDQKAFEQLAQVCGKGPLATLTVTEKDLPTQAHRAAVEKFAEQLRLA